MLYNKLLFMKVCVLLVAVIFLAACSPTTIKTTEDKTPQALLVQTQQTTQLVLKDREVYELTAERTSKTIAEQDVTLYTFNHQFPGPQLVVEQGTNATIQFTNNLPEPTTIHWHGLRVENRFDGVPHVTQQPVQPGETFTYELSFPDPGLYWYHSHLREDRQQELGLYGTILVRAPEEVYGPSDAEETIILDDLLMDGDGIESFTETPNHVIMGRYGNTMLVNGETNYAKTVTQGSAVRLYFLNAANTRPFRISIPNAQVKLVGLDNGPVLHQALIAAVILAPSDRAVVDVLFDKPGTYELIHTTDNKEYVLGTFTVVPGSTQSEEFATLQTSEALSLDVERLSEALESEPAVTYSLLAVTRTHMNMGHGMMFAQPIEWEDTMGEENARATTDDVAWVIRDRQSGLEGMDAHFMAHVGDVKKIRIVNAMHQVHPMQHPIHIHGQRFMVAAVDGKPTENYAWEDTVLVPAGSTVDVIVEFTNPGEWMIHCHISEHLEAGMMTGFTVEA